MRSGNRYIKHTFNDLFSKTSLIPHVLIPKHLCTLKRNLEGFVTIDLNDWITNHTLFYYFTNFSDIEVRESVFHSMVKGEVRNFPIPIEPNFYLKFCPECVKEDYKLYGETYWRRCHQVPGVYYCFIHEKILEDSSVISQVRYKKKTSLEAATLENCLINESSQYNTFWNHTNLLWEISIQCSKISSVNLQVKSEDMHEIYRILLYREGYVKANKKNFKKLAIDFINFYGVEFLDLIGEPSEVNKKCSWLDLMCNKTQGTFHPMKHALLTLFLNESVENLYKYKSKKIEPFGKGPYICLNPFASHYKQYVIKDFTLETCPKTKEEVGIFYCECGFQFTRFSNSTHVFIKQIKYVDDKWWKRYLDWKRDFKAPMGYETRLDIKKNMRHKFNWYSIGYSRSGAKDKIAQRRNEFINLIKENPDSNLEAINKINKQPYAFLLKHDKKWLKKNMPNVNKYISRSFDWKARDTEMLEIIIKAKEVLLNKENPTKITITSIGRITGKLDIIRKPENLKRMPKTNALLKSIIETDEQFQLRRVTKTIADLVEVGEFLTVSKIRRLANIEKGKSDIVDNKILDACTKQSN